MFAEVTVFPSTYIVTPLKRSLAFVDPLGGTT
jgi:hypothetical protein